MKLLERYNTEIRLRREQICLGEPVRAFVVNLHNFKPEFWGMLPGTIAADKSAIFIMPKGRVTSEQVVSDYRLFEHR